MFLTMPLTTAPSDSVDSSFSRTSPWLSSSTARRDTTTLLRLRSSLMTLKSSALFSNGDVSLTGRMSTSEPGRNARMPLIMTVRPPLTLLVTRPCTTRPCSIAASRSCHAFRRLALSRDSLRLAVAVLERFDGDGDEIAGLDFDFALVVLEFLDRDERLGLEAGVDDDDVEVDAHDFGGDQFALAHFLARQRFLEQRGEIFHRRIGGGGHGGHRGGGSHVGLVPSFD